MCVCVCVCISSVQSLSCVQLFAIPWTAACPSPTPGVYSNSWQLSQWCHPTICHPLSSPSPAFSLCQHQGLFQWVCSLYQVAKVLQFQHQSFQWIFRLISFRMDWLDLLAVQWTLKSLFQHHSSKASILQRSAFFKGQLSTSMHDYWKNHSFD